MPEIPDWVTPRRLGCTVLLLFGIAFAYDFGSPVHYSDDIRLRIIDESTGLPIAGAAILATWSLSGGLEGGNLYPVYAADAITDARGRAIVPGMPLRIRPPFQRFKSFDPWLVVYAPGYWCNSVTNWELSDHSAGQASDSRAMKRRSFWDGKTIPLEPAETPHEQLKSIDCMRNDRVFQVYPRKFIRVWQVMAEGYRRLPPGSRGFGSDPQDVIDRMTKEGQE